MRKNVNFDRCLIKNRKDVIVFPVFSFGLKNISAENSRENIFRNLYKSPENAENIIVKYFKIFDSVKTDDFDYTEDYIE